MGRDLVFRKAHAIAGGREHLVGEGKLEEGATPSSLNNFQGRYIIRNPWKGRVTCAQPVFGRWGPPSTNAVPSANTLPRKVRTFSRLAPYVVDDIPELSVRAGVGKACWVSGARGVCEFVASCRGESTPGYCPGGADIQCCLE